MIVDGRWNNGQLEGKITIRFNDDDTKVIAGMVVDGICVHTGNEFSPPVLLPYLPSFFTIEL